MNPSMAVLRLLPEIIFTITGIVIMVVDPCMDKQANRKPLGWVAAIGALAALIASIFQYWLPAGTAYFGIVQTDAFSVFFHILISGIILVSVLVGIDAVHRNTENLGEFFALMSFGAVGMLLMTSGVGLLLIFIGLEISSISTYILAGFRRTAAKSPESAIKYFLLGSFATAFFLYGIALTYGATGTTKITGIAAGLTTSHALPIAVVGLAFIIIGLAFKVSAAPFHFWTPDVYEGAPSPIVGLMSTAPKAAAFAVLLRIAYEAFPQLQHHWTPLLWILAAISMTIGNLGAFRQKNVKRMLAYSSIAHAGYLLVAFTVLSPDGVAAACFYAAAYAIMNVGVFAIVSHAGAYEDRLTLIEDYKGLAYRSPLLGGVMAFFLISLIGIPFTGGFFGKFYVFAAAIHSGMIWLAIIGLVNSGIAVFYYLRVITATYTKPMDSSPVLNVPRVSAPLFVAMVVTVAATLVLGIIPGRVLSAARSAAETFPYFAAQQLPAAAPAASTTTVAAIHTKAQ